MMWPTIENVSVISIYLKHIYSIYLSSVCPDWKREHGCSDERRDGWSDTINSLCPRTCGLCGERHNLHFYWNQIFRSWCCPSVRPLAMLKTKGWPWWPRWFRWPWWPTTILRWPAVCQLILNVLDVFVKLMWNEKLNQLFHLRKSDCKSINTS